MSTTVKTPLSETGNNNLFVFLGNIKSVPFTYCRSFQKTISLWFFGVEILLNKLQQGGFMQSCCRPLGVNMGTMGMTWGWQGQHGDNISSPVWSPYHLWCQPYVVPMTCHSWYCPKCCPWCHPQCHLHVFPDVIPVLSPTSLSYQSHEISWDFTQKISHLKLCYKRTCLVAWS